MPIYSLQIKGWAWDTLGHSVQESLKSSRDLAIKCLRLLEDRVVGREKITMEQPWKSGWRSVKGSLQGWCHPAFFCYTVLPIAIMDFHCVPSLPSLLKMGVFLNPYCKMQNTLWKQAYWTVGDCAKQQDPKEEFVRQVKLGKQRCWNKGELVSKKLPGQLQRQAWHWDEEGNLEKRVWCQLGGDCPLASRVWHVALIRQGLVDGLVRKVPLPPPSSTLLHLAWVPWGCDRNHPHPELGSKFFLLSRHCSSA